MTSILELMPDEGPSDFTIAHRPRGTRGSFLRYLLTSHQFSLITVPSQAFRDACLSGSVASITSTAALAICGQAEDGAPAGPINGPSQWLWGESEAYTKEVTWRHTATGCAIHHAMSILWATLYEGACRSEERKGIASVCLDALSVSSLAYVVDYHVAPRRLHPGFKKHLGPRSIFMVYAAFAAGLALTTLVKQGRNVSRGERDGRSK